MMMILRKITTSHHLRQNKSLFYQPSIHVIYHHQYAHHHTYVPRLNQFSMHPSQILEVKQEVLRSNAAELATKVSKILKLDEPDKIREAVDKL